MLRSISLKVVIALGLLFSGANAQLLDDDFYQHAVVDSTVAVGSDLELWLFLYGPKDTAFSIVSQVNHNQQFVITIGDITYLFGYTLYFLPDFGTPITGSTLVRLKWTNTYDDNGFESSGRIDGIDVRIKEHIVPGDSITLATWDTDSQVVARDGVSPPDAWTLSLGTGGQPDSATILNVPAGVAYWVAIRSRDEARNWSLVSNNVLKASGGTLDSTTTQTYQLVTTWNKWNGSSWDTGPAGPTTIIEITLGVLPQGEEITVSPDIP